MHGRLMGAPRARLDVGAALLGGLIVITACELYVSGLPRVLDPMMSMEPHYIHAARQPLAQILRDDPAWGPLYALWFKPLVALFGDPLAVYAANVLAQSTGLTVLIYLHLLLVTRRAAPAAAAALLFLVSDLNIPLAGKVSSFAMMIALAGLTLAQLVPAGVRRLSVSAAGILLAAYARPELYPAALLLAGLALRQARVEARTDRRVLLWPAAVIVAIVGWAMLSGTPLYSPYHPGDRLLTAFREHFAWNWGRWNDEWLYYRIPWERTFGDAGSIAEAVSRNPLAVLRHLGANLAGTMRFLIWSSLDHYPVLIPATRPRLAGLENGLVSLAVLGCVVAGLARAPWRRQLWTRYGDVLLPYAALSACSLLSAILIYPVTRYLAIPAVCLLLTATLATTLWLPGAALAWRWRLVAAVAVLAAVPTPFVLPSEHAVADSPFLGRIAVSRPITDTVAFVRGLGLPAPVDVLTMTDGIGDMLGDDFREVKIWQRGDQALEDYVRAQGIDVIVSMEPGHHSFFIQDPYFKLLQTDPDRTGFVRYGVPGQDHISVFVRRDLARHVEPSTQRRRDAEGAESE